MLDWRRTMSRNLKVERYYPHPQRVVWDAITDTDTLETWLSACDFTPEVGHEFRLAATPGPGFDGQVRCRVLEVDAPRTLSFSWNGGPIETVVTLSLSPDGDGTRLTLLQSGFTDVQANTLLPLLHLWWQASLSAQLLGRLAPTVSAVSTGTLAVGAIGSSLVCAAALIAGTSLLALEPTAAASLGSVDSPDAPLNWESPAPEEAPIDAVEEQIEATSDEAPTIASPAVTADRFEEFAGPVAVGDAVRPKGSINYYEEALPTTLNPLYAKTMVDFRTQELIFDRLFYRSTGGLVTSHIVASLASSTDHKAVTLKLVSGVEWHDGKALSPADVCFTVDALRDPAVGSTRVQYRALLDGCVASGDSATIRFTRPVHDVGSELDFPVLPKHAFSGAITPEDRFATHPIGTGAMRVAKASRSITSDASGWP